MKNLLNFNLLLLGLLILVLSCSKENDEATAENQWKAKINGKDSVFTINKATIQTISGHKQLSIITDLSGTSFDLYVHAPEITTGEYPVANPFDFPYPEVFSSCYYRILQPNSVYTAQAFVSTVESAECKTVITEINGNKVKGTVVFKAIDYGLYTSGELMISASFSTDKLEYITK